MDKTALNKKSNALLKKRFEKLGITRCEKCGATSMLSWAHFKKRRYITTLEELSNPRTTLLLCIPCHMSIEFDKLKRDELFSRLRN